jgi:hypothetical protein
MKSKIQNGLNDFPHSWRQLVVFTGMAAHAVQLEKLMPINPFLDSGSMKGINFPKS